MIDLEIYKHYLDIRVTQDCGWGLIYLSLFTYITKALHQFGLDRWHFVSTSIDWKKYLKLEQSNIDSDLEILEWYQLAIGALLWIINVKLDISFTIFTMAQFTSNPTLTHILTIKRIFCYLNGTTDYVICYGNNNNSKLYGYVDSDWNDCQQTFCSITGYIFFKNRDVVSHFLKQQQTITYLSIEAKCTALCQAIKEVIWLHLLKLKLEGEIFSIMLKTDNKSSIALAFNQEFHAQTKYIGVKTYYIQERIAQGNIKLKWIERVKNVTDLFIKLLDRILF